MEHKAQELGLALEVSLCLIPGLYVFIALVLHSPWPTLHLDILLCFILFFKEVFLE